MSYPMGESKFPPLRVNFDHRLKLEFHGSKITSDAGLLAYRELDEVLGLTDLSGTVLSDLRRGKNTRHLLTGLLRQSVFGRLAGYEDVNDAERLSRDPAMRVIVGRKGLDRRAASTSAGAALRLSEPSQTGLRGDLHPSDFSDQLLSNRGFLVVPGNDRPQ